MSSFELWELRAHWNGGYVPELCEVALTEESALKRAEEIKLEIRRCWSWGDYGVDVSRVELSGALTGSSA